MKEELVVSTEVIHTNRHSPMIYTTLVDLCDCSKSTLLHGEYLLDSRSVRYVQ